MFFNTAHTFDGHDCCHWNDDEEEELFKGNIKWSVNAKHAIPVKEPVTLSDCVSIPNQSSVPKAFQQFDENDRMKPSAFYNRMVDVMEELMKFTLLTRSCSDYLTDRYSERVETAEKLTARVNATD